MSFKGKNNPHWKGGKIKVICSNQFCDNEFLRHPGAYKRSKYLFCCSECHNEFRRKPKDPNRLRRNEMKGGKHPRWAGSKHCRVCGVELFGRQQRKYSYCSDDCKNKNKRQYLQGENHPGWIDVKILCRYCSVEIKTKDRMHRTFCSKKCYGKWKTEFWSRENNPLWQGGSAYSEYPIEFNAKLRLKIRRRDGFCCQKCGREQRGLDVHHIDNNKQNSNEDNLISLCRSCHRKAHWQMLKNLEP